MRKRVQILFAAGALLLAGVPARAHHAFSAEFDTEKPIKFKGTVTKMEWTNSLLRRGWTKNSLPVGTEIIVEGFQAKDSANRANGSVITFTDGRKLFIGNPAGDPGAAPGTTENK